MSIKQILLEYQIHDSFEDAKNALIKHGVDIGEELDYYIGSGDYGDVYKVKGKNKVIKFYDDEIDFEMYETMMKHQQYVNPEHVVKVFLNRKVGKFYISVLEYLEPLSFTVKRITNLLIKNVEVMHQRYGSQMGKVNKEDILNQMDIEKYRPLIISIVKNYKEVPELMISILFILNGIRVNHAEFIFVDALQLASEQPQFFKDIFAGIQELNAMGLEHNDIHAGNVLVDPKTKKYKLIDPVGI